MQGSLIVVHKPVVCAFLVNADNGHAHRCEMGRERCCQRRLQPGDADHARACTKVRLWCRAARRAFSPSVEPTLPQLPHIVLEQGATLGIVGSSGKHNAHCGAPFVMPDVVHDPGSRTTDVPSGASNVKPLRAPLQARPRRATYANYYVQIRSS